MFSDLVGSTALSARMDPEDLREVISAYQKCVAETVGRLGGFIAKYMGDGVLIYFGYPHPHEDDAERAVRAGLALVAAVGALKWHSRPCGRQRQSRRDAGYVRRSRPARIMQPAHSRRDRTRAETPRIQAETMMAAVASHRYKVKFCHLYQRLMEPGGAALISFAASKSEKEILP